MHRLRAVTLSAAIALVAAPVALPAAAAPRPQDPVSRLADAPDAPKTPFEASNGATWTSFPQARDFLRALDAGSPRVEGHEVGTSGQGRPILAYAVGHPRPKSPQGAAAGSVLAFNCSIHGDEPSGREACMVLARDLSTTADPRTRRFLASTTVLFLFPNPDGWVADTRTNAAKIDVNRDMLAGASPEARAIIGTISTWRPDVLNDLHEYGMRQDYQTDALTLWPRNRNTDRVVHDLSQRMVQRYTAPRITAQGLSNADYGRLVKDGEPYLQVAGDAQARILRNYAGLRHVVGQLTEARQEPVTAAEKADAALNNRRRVSVQYASAVGSIEFLTENRARVTRAAAAASQRATDLGAKRAGLVYFGGQDDMIPTKASEVERNPMCGYALTGDQAKEYGALLDLHGVQVKTAADGARWVPMAQPARGLIPLLLDARSEHGVAKATPLAQCPAG